MSLIFFFAKKESIWLQNSNISTDNFVLEMSLVFFLQEAKAFSEESHHLPSKVKLLALQAPALNLFLLPWQTRTLHGAWKLMEHSDPEDVCFTIFSSCLFMFVLLEACALGSVSVRMYVCLYLF